MSSSPATIRTIFNQTSASYTPPTKKSGFQPKLFKLSSRESQREALVAGWPEFGHWWQKKTQEHTQSGRPQCVTRPRSRHKAVAHCFPTAPSSNFPNNRPGSCMQVCPHPRMWDGVGWEWASFFFLGRSAELRCVYAKLSCRRLQRFRVGKDPSHRATAPRQPAQRGT